MKRLTSEILVRNDNVGTHIRIGSGCEFDVDEVKVAKIESQTVKYKDHDFLLKAKYKPPNRPLKQNYINTLMQKIL